MKPEKTPIIGKKRKIIILFFVIVISSGNTINITLATSNADENIKILFNKKSPHPNPLPKGEGINKIVATSLPMGEIEGGQKKEYFNKSVSNYSKKRELKREIKRRKKYHKTLLESYNNDFNNNDFDLLTKNSQMISNLREEFENKGYLT